MARVIALSNPEDPTRLQWAHLSVRGESVRLRVRGGQALVDASLDGLPVDYVDLSAGEAVRRLADKDRDFMVVTPPPYTDGLWWWDFLSRLDRAFPDVDSIRTPDGVRVPITVLRELYEQPETRRLTRGDGSACRLLLRLLPTLWRDSTNHFASYQNHEAFNQERDPLDSADESANPQRTNDAVASIQAQGGIGDGLVYVEREFSPRRTTGAILENGLPARSSGSGGADLLFARNGEPVIGELKLEGDASAAFALIQALTYAAELATPNQLTRLKDHLPTAFGSIDPHTTPVHIALLIAAHESDPTLIDTLAAVRNLNDGANRPERLGTVSIYVPHGTSWVRLPGS